ncbi:magnesium transporter MgtE [Gordonia hirsuta DSM 44140 = NBRC 16056]|uniref:Magnesium transporter MgtE n=1 Tax=Gordonia hirsuta DSM 44140 = NBRC 16056 TaxID=1121927 RepID=L7L6A4_9ACTN|nr:magnesium transporter [Gordonia hirsuta]GAC56291.1 magnesium transporter MgtE [Gordonia hirsuta DSM 44140 = NBRC 16056]
MYRNEIESLAVLGRIPTLAERIDDDPACDLAAWRTEIRGRNNRSEQAVDLSGNQSRALVAAHTLSELDELFAAIRNSAGARLLRRVDPAAAAALSTMTPSTAGRILRQMGSRQEAVLAAMSGPRRTELETLLTYPAESVGAHMTLSLLAMPATGTAHEAVEMMRGAGPHTESAHYVHLLGPGGELVGVAGARDVMLSPSDTELGTLAGGDIVSIDAFEDQEVLVGVFAEYPYASIPVIADGRLVGVVTAERAAEIQATETTEDFRRMGAVGGLPMSLRDAGVWALYRSRVGWLVLLVFGNIFSGAGIAHYEDLIAATVSLVFFLPLLIDSGGNAGSQSSTLMVRALAIGDVRMRDWGKLLGREVLVALLLGVSMAAAVSLLGLARGGTEVALVVSLSVILIVVVGAVIGMSLPFLLTKLKLDPASASAPLITSICDGVGVLIYFFIASQIML